MAKANKGKTEDTKGPEIKNSGPVMCQIPQTSLTELYNWVTGANMIMPYNQVAHAVKLINTATIIEQPNSK